MQAVDALCGLFTPSNIQSNFLHGEEGKRLQSVGRLAGLRGYSAREFRDRLSMLGVEKAMIPSLYTKSYFGDGSVEHFALADVVDVVQAEAETFFGLYGIDVRTRMAGVRELERCVEEYGFKGVHIHPHGFGMDVDHAFYFPFYAKCEELGVPVALSMGNTLDFMPVEVANPIKLDRVALYFPSLKIVCAHTGWPWVREAIALAAKHENVFIATSAYAPKYWDGELIQFLNSSRGRGKVMWGTDYPLIDHEQALQQIEALNLKDESAMALLSSTAMAVFDLPTSDGLR